MFQSFMLQEDLHSGKQETTQTTKQGKKKRRGCKNCISYSGISSNGPSKAAQFCLQLCNSLANKRLKAWDSGLDHSFQMLNI